MWDRLEIGPTPSMESCEQLGPNYDAAYARAECRAFIGQIRRELGPEPEGAVLKVVGNQHDFGTYYEVAVKYDETCDAAIEYAYRVESDAPEEWDSIARKELSDFKAAAANPLDI